MEDHSLRFQCCFATCRFTNIAPARINNLSGRSGGAVVVALDNEYQHPESVLHLLTPEQGYPNFAAAYGFELHSRFYELSFFLRDSCDDTAPECWHERMLILAGAMLINLHVAKEHWNRSDWSSMMEFLADLDRRMVELKGMVKPAI